MELKPAERGVSGGEVNLEFDPSALEATRVEPGDLFGADPLVGLEEIDNETGALGYVLARVGPTEVPTPTGVFAVITFRVLENARAGTYELVVTKVGLADETFQDILGISVQGASVKVIQ